MSNIAAIAGVLGAVTLAWVAWNANQQAAETVVYFLSRARYVIGGVWLGIIGWHLLQSGSTLLIGLALTGAFFIALWAFIERPWADVI